MMELHPEDKSSMRNVYESTYMNNVINDEFNRSKNMYSKGKNPSKTGVVPLPADSSMFANINSQQKNDKFLSLLSGQEMEIKQFKHNNMQPFIKGGVTQNTNIEKFTQKLDLDTGVDKFYRKKQEVENRNIPTRDISNINGSKVHTDFYTSRAKEELSTKQNNVSPIEKIYVGPGLNQGYTSRGSGGFQQSNTNEYAKPKTLDDLRSKINQKETYFNIPFQAHAKGTDQRGIVTPYKKNKPERTYNQTEDNWIKTTGAVLKESRRPEHAIKVTHRPDLHTEYTGGAKLENIKGMSLADDHGKNNIIIYDNERQETQTRTRVSNITSTVKALVSPVVDALKFTIKEYMVDAPRANGNSSAQIPKKPTTYNPDDVMKTTVKETTIHDSEILNLSGHDSTYSALHDEAKTTVKETLIHDSDLLNIKTTNNSSYLKTDEITRTTLKETLPVQDTVRNIGKAEYKVYMYNPDNVAKKTVKETTIKGTAELGFIGGILNGLLGGYATSEVEIRNTHKQFTVDHQEFGVAKSVNDNRQMSREAEENAEINGAREAMLIAAGNTPNPGRMNIPIDKDDITMKSNRLVGDSYAVREAGNVNVIYQRSPEMDECTITRDTDDMNAYENRLDGNLLSGLQSNEFNININPIHSMVN